MYIKNLEIDNFKSFASKAEIPFREGFTTVSGPNGSGKSNIIDSVLFALGLANARELRAGNISHFISTYTKRNEVYVKVTFGGLEDGQELAVARRIRKTSQGYVSTYYLNDSVATLSNVHAVLEQYNVTPNSYNVIMQGDVTRIIGCSPTERRKIIDEIAGIADFDRRIDEATARLEEVGGKVDRVTVILNEVEKGLEQLKAEREVALKYNDLKQKKQDLESQVSKVNFFSLKRGLEQAHLNILEFTKKKKEEEVCHKDLRERLELLKKKYEELLAEVNEKGAGRQLELQKREETLKGDISRNEASINYSQKQIHDGLRTIENSKNAIEKNTALIKDLNLNIELKNDEIAMIQRNIATKQEELRKINEDMTGLSDSSDKQIEKRNKLRKELDQLKNEEYEILQKTLPLENDLRNLTEKIDQYKNDLVELEKSKTTFNSDYELKKSQVEQLEKELQDFKNIQQNTRDELDIVKNEIGDFEYKVAIANKKVSELEVKKQFAEENLGREIDTVMSAKLRGVHAPLVQLGTVDKEFSTAMEVAFGGRMAHIVVDDERVASTAIELLLSTGAGRATFIPLNKIKPAPTKLQLPKDKGVIDFAINLVDFDDLYLDAFFYAVGDTLVVEDKECANKLIGKYRMVTLNGELFEKSGSITGGKLRRSGLSFSQNDDEELNKFKQRLKELETTLVKKKQNRVDLDAKLDKIRGMYSDTSNEYSKAKVELANMKLNFENGEKFITEKSEFIAQNEPKIAEFNKQLDKLEETNVKILDKKMILEDEIAEIEKLIDDTDLKALKEKTSGVEAEIKRLEARNMQANGENDGFKRQIGFYNDVIASKQEEISRIEENNKVLENDISRFKNNIVEINKQMEELKVQLEEIETKLGVLLKQRDTLHNDVIELEKQSVLKASDIEHVAEQIESFKARRRELEPQLETAKTELINSGVDIDKLEPVEISLEEITSKIQRVERQMADLGDVNMRAIQTYEENLVRQKDLKEKIDTLTLECKEIKEKMNGYEELKKETFLKTFNNINENFKEVFHTLAEGEGQLLLENPSSPLDGGMTIEAQPREKRVQRLESMSGGEKSMTALAFVLAIQRYMPSPFYAFDEVDANLDTINVEHIAQMVKEQSKDTQFIVVSHRKPMIDSANRTIGVTQKEKGKTVVTGIER